MVALEKNNKASLVRRTPAASAAGSQADSGFVPGEREAEIASPLPFLGLGMGLRSQHYHQILTQKPKIDWFEIISENFLFGTPRANEILDEILDSYPVIMHGVAMYPGNAQGVDFDYLRQLKSLIRKVNPAWISDHLCWGSVDGKYSHDLLPLPYTEETIALTAENLRIAQDYLETPLILENVSSYATFKDSRMSEWEFLGEITARAGTGILLDINNVYVSARNHGFDPREYLDSIDVSRVQQVHLAGHSDHGSYVLDTHDGPVIPEVWELYDYFMKKSGPRSTMIEWDASIPEFQVVYEEIQKARSFWPEEFGRGVGIHSNAQSGCALDLNGYTSTVLGNTVNHSTSKSLNGPEVVFQRLMLSGLMAPYSRGNEPAESVACKTATLKQAAELIMQQGELSALDRLELYRKQMRIRFQESLEEDFRYLSKYLNSSASDGRDTKTFTQILDEYLTEFPANSHSLWDLGLRMPEFLEEHYTEDQTAAELAKLDLLLLKLGLTKSGPDDKPLDFSQSETLGATVKFTFHKHVQPLTLSGEALRIASALKLRDGLNGKPLLTDEFADFSRPVLITDSLNDLEQPEILCYPSDFTELLNAVAGGGTLEDILNHCDTLPQDTQLQLGFAVWQNNKWLVELHD